MSMFSWPLFYVSVIALSDICPVTEMILRVLITINIYVFTMI